MKKLIRYFTMGLLLASLAGCAGTQSNTYGTSGVSPSWSGAPAGSSLPHGCSPFMNEQECNAWLYGGPN